MFSFHFLFYIPQMILRGKWEVGFKSASQKSDTVKMYININTAYVLWVAYEEREHTAHVWICLVYVSMITLFCNGTSVLHQALTKFQIETFRVHGTFLFHFVIKHEIRMNKTNYMHEKKKNNLFTILCTKAKKKKTMNFRYYIMMVLLLLLLSLLILLYDVKCDDMKCV